MKTKKKREANEPDLSSREAQRLRVLYRACVQNAEDLLSEACLFSAHAKYARGTFLALTAYEEMGKAQLVADYAANAASAHEMKLAFRDHLTKMAYMNRFITLPVAGPLKHKAKGNEIIHYDLKQAKYHVDLRERSLYVQRGQPSDNLVVPSQITKAECNDTIERVQEYFDSIEEAEWLNGRIGSKALFK